MAYLLSPQPSLTGPSMIAKRSSSVGGGAGGISADILTDLEGHYALEETVGSTAADSTANARDGSIATGAAWSELSIVGSGCGEFDGANAYVDLPTMGMPTGADACSVVLWVNPSGSTGDRNIASNNTGRVGDTGKSYLELRLSDTNKVLLTVGNQQVASGTIESTATIPTGTWTQIIATYDGSRTRAGLKLYINNAEATVTETGTASWSAGTDTDDWVLGGASGVDKGNSLIAGTLDDIRLYSRVLAEADRTALYALRNAAAAPVAFDVAISGTETEGETLTGSYTYYSNYGYAEGTTTFRWLRDDVAIDGATSTTYTLVTADVGTVITFEVTPISVTAPTTGTPVVSAGTGAIAAANVAPVASSVAFTGTETVGEVLTRTYSYSDADGDSEGSSTTQWYRADNGSGLNEAAIAGATSATYTLVSADEGKFVRVGVTPVASTGVSPGTEAFSSYSGAIAAATTDFITTWETTDASAATRTITIPTTGTGFSYDIDWGDGTVETGQTSGYPSHEYASGLGTATRTITISGTFPRVYFNNAGDKTKLRTVSQWGVVGFTSCEDAFHGCSNLTTVAAGLTSIASMREMFRGCSSLTSIPTGFLLAPTALTNAYAAFYGCSSLTTLPSDGLFAGCTSLTSIGTSNNGLFASCTSLVTVPGNTFQGCSGIASTIDTFRSCSSLLSLPSGLFDDLSGCSEFKQTFYSAGITSVTDGANWDWTGITDATSMFFGCTINTTDYNAMWIGIDAQTLQSGVAFHGGSSVATGAGLTARNSVVTNESWTVTDAS